MNTNYHHIDYQYVYLNFNWTWIRDKQIIHKEDSAGGGALFILDEEGNLVKGYGYERIV